MVKYFPSDVLYMYPCIRREQVQYIPPMSTELQTHARHPAAHVYIYIPDKGNSKCRILCADAKDLFSAAEIMGNLKLPHTQNDIT